MVVPLLPVKNCWRLHLQAMPFLSVGEESPYGHSTAQTLNALRRHNISLYRTDVQGEITAYSDGQQIWFSTAPCENWSAGAQELFEEPLTTVIPQISRYVLNTHTKKFHNPDCSSVEQMNDKNKAFTDASREELMARGYTACDSRALRRKKRLSAW